MRDSYVFNAPNRGTAVQWCRMGDGNIGMEDYIRKYVAQCPGAAVSLEVIVSNTPRVFNYRDPQAWDHLPDDAGVGVRALPRPLRSRRAARAAASGTGPRRWRRRRVGQGQPAAGAPAGAAAGAPQGAPPAQGGRGGGGGQPNPEAQRINREHVEASLQWTRDLLAKL